MRTSPSVIAIDSSQPADPKQIIEATFLVAVYERMRNLKSKIRRGRTGDS